MVEVVVEKVGGIGCLAVEVVVEKVGGIDCLAVAVVVVVVLRAGGAGCLAGGVMLKAGSTGCIAGVAVKVLTVGGTTRCFPIIAGFAVDTGDSR